LTQALNNVILSKQLTIQNKIRDILIAQMPCQSLLLLDQELQPIYISDGFFNIFREWQKRFPNESIEDFKLPPELIARCRGLMNTNQPISGEGFQSIEISQMKGRNRLSINLMPINQMNGSPMFLISFIPHESFLLHSEPLQQIGLSKRELEVISLLFLGLKNLEIASRLFISELTVENHLRAIFQKLQVKNRTSVLKRVLNLISPMWWPNTEQT
jgi:DNA-binding CsgD family transcriptional regulator